MIVDLHALLARCRASENPLEVLRSQFGLEREADRETLARNLARATEITGRMLEALAERRRIGQAWAEWVTRVGRVLWGLVEVATPRNFGSLLFRHWLKLFYAFSIALLIAANVFSASPEVGWFGWKALGLTVALNIVVQLLRDFFRYRRTFWQFLKVLACAAALILIGLGIAELRHLKPDACEAFPQWAPKLLSCPASPSPNRS